jgi:hypothetical protein
MKILGMWFPRGQRGELHRSFRTIAMVDLHRTLQCLAWGWVRTWHPMRAPDVDVYVDDVVLDLERVGWFIVDVERD